MCIKDLDKLGSSQYLLLPKLSKIYCSLKKWSKVTQKNSYRASYQGSVLILDTLSNNHVYSRLKSNLHVPQHLTFDVFFFSKKHLAESFCNFPPLHILSPSFYEWKNWLDIYLSARAWIGTFQTSEVHFDMIYSTYNFTCPWFERGAVCFPNSSLQRGFSNLFKWINVRVFRLSWVSSIYSSILNNIF